VRAAPLLLCCLWACGPAPPPAGPRAPQKKLDPLEALRASDAPRIVVVERGDSGSRLVLIDEAGLRQGELTATAEPTLDLMPAWSPDGRFVAFASSRGRRSLKEWSLWIVPADGEGEARRLTDDGGVDSAPSWSSDGRSLVFSSTRGGGQHLFRLELDGDGNAAGAPRQLTSGAVEAHFPSWSSRGEIAYTAVEGERSHIAVIGDAGGGEPRAVTQGPADSWPDWTPDGKAIVFVAPAPGRGDTDLHLVGADGAGRRHLVDDPLGDEATPRVSADGRFVLAATVVRTIDGAALTSLLVAADLEARAPSLRGLIDRFPSPRMAADVAPVPLAPKPLLAAPPVKEALRAVLSRPRVDD
jgi:Tol biopolymer transport system component